MQDINAWLQGNREYELGVELYAKYGKSSFLKSLFAKDGPTSFNIQKLEAALYELAPTPPASSEIVFENGSIIKIEPALDRPELNGHSIDAIVVDVDNHKIYIELKDKQRLKYRQLDHNKAILELTNDKHVLHQTAKQIMYLDDEITRIWHQIDYYDQTGYFPHQEVKSPPKTDEIQRLHSSISQANKRLKKDNCRNPEATKKLIEEKKARLAELMEGAKK